MTLRRYDINVRIDYEYEEVDYDGGDHASAYEALDIITVLQEQVAAKDARIAELESQLKEGTEDGSRCNRRCDGVMVLGQPVDCSCHISAPCGACEDMRPECSLCGEVVE